MITIKTNREIISTHKDRKGNYITLAKKGEVVDFIADHDDIIIVRKGNDRFPVRREDLEMN